MILFHLRSTDLCLGSCQKVISFTITEFSIEIRKLQLLREHLVVEYVVSMFIEYRCRIPIVFSTHNVYWNSVKELHSILFLCSNLSPDKKIKLKNFVKLPMDSNSSTPTTFSQTL